MAKIIYIEPGDLITSVVDKLISERAKSVFLVIPSNAVFWRDTINLRLLKREMANSNKSIIIINPDYLRRELAEKSGFMAMEELPRKTSEEPRPEEYRIEESLENILLSGERERVVAPEKKLKKVSDIVRRPVKKEAKKTSGISKKINMVSTGLVIGGLGREADDLADDADEKVYDSIEINETKIENSPNINFYKNSEDEERRGVEEEFFGKKSFSERFDEKGDNGAETEGNDVKMEDGKVVKIRKKYFWGKSKNGAPKSFSVFMSVIFVTAAFVAAGAAFIILPRAGLYISRKIEPVAFDINVNVNAGITSIDFNKNEIPGQILKVTKGLERKFLATGEREVEKKASGMITIYNELDSTPQSMIPSRFQDVKTGKIFWSVKSVIVPGATIKDGQILPGTINMEIEAGEAGGEFNMDCSKNNPCEFTIPAWKGTVKYDKLYAKAISSISGGSIGKVKVVTTEDINSAKKEIDSALDSELRNAFLEKVPGNLKLLEGSLLKEVVSEKITAQAGDIANDFTYELMMELSGFIFNENDMESLIGYNLAGKITEDKELISGGRKINFDVSRKNNGDATIRVYGSDESAFVIDSELIKKEVVGKDEIELRKYFGGIDGVESVRVDFWPFWVNKAPNKVEKINMVIEK